MGAIRADSPLEALKRPWNPLLRMQQTDELAPKLGISTFWGRFAFAQLTYMDLPYSDLGDLAARFRSDRLNWDSVYAQDLATLLSILVTNNIKLDSWEVFDRMVDAYRQGWRERFLLSLFCEATSHPGYCGSPLYFSELVGYTSGGAHQPGLLEVMESSGAEQAFDWLHRRMLIKLRRPEVREMLEKDFAGSHRCRVYPFLVFGSHGWAAYNQFERRGGLESLVRPAVPAEVRREVYIMAICCFSGYFYHSREQWDGLFSQACRVGINGLQHAGASSRIDVCPLFAFLQSEIGHLWSSQVSGGKVDGGLLSEVMDRLQMNSYVSLGGIEKAEEELDFSSFWPGAPEEMRERVDKDRWDIRTTRAHASYRVNPDWLKKLREM